MSSRLRWPSQCAWGWLFFGVWVFWTSLPGMAQEPLQLPPGIDSIDEAAELTEPFEIGESDTEDAGEAPGILERLERAERSISKLQSLSEPAAGSSQGKGPGAAQSGVSKSLEGKFEELQNKLSKKTYPSVEIHGVFQADSGWFGQDEASRRTVGNLQDGADFRRARLSANGSLTETMNYFLQFDFAFPGRPTFTDLWWEATRVPVLGNIRVGQWKQPFSLEVVSSFRYTTFAERSLGFQAFTPFRHLAVGFYDWNEDETMTWAASLYRPGQDQYGASIADRGGYAGVGRVTWLPWYEDAGKDYLHLGAAYNHVAPAARLARFRTIPEYFIGAQQGDLPLGTSGQAIPGPFDGVPFFVDTRAFAVNHYNLVGTELLWVKGPLSFQSEWMTMMATRTNGAAAVFPSIYGQAGYFLTGEHRPYQRKLGAIDRVKPLRPLAYRCEDQEPGLGAWEVAGRWSYIDLNDKEIQGGRLNDMTLGLNWYLNAYAKVQFNCIRAFLDNPVHNDSITDIYGLRTQIDF
ncbi:MAG: OprO/OprP family phosphate-selective porin [Planctomycetaceae bacterium]